MRTAQLLRALAAGDCSASACFATLLAVSLYVTADAPKPQFSGLALCILACFQSARHQLVRIGKLCLLEFSGHAMLPQSDQPSGWIFTYLG